jgi:hypothetical protein
VAGTDLELKAPVLSMGVEARQEAQQLVDAQFAFTKAFFEARALGRQMLACFELMDKARKDLEEQGVVVAVVFPDAIQAALWKHRGMIGDDLELPEFMAKVPVNES